MNLAITVVRYLSSTLTHTYVNEERVAILRIAFYLTVENIPDIKKLIKKEKSRIRGLAVARSDQPVDRKDMKSVVKIFKLFI